VLEMFVKQERRVWRSRVRRLEGPNRQAKTVDQQDSAMDQSWTKRRGTVDGGSEIDVGRSQRQGRG